MSRTRKVVPLLVFNVGFPILQIFKCNRPTITKYILPAHHGATLMNQKRFAKIRLIIVLQERPLRIIDFKIDDYDVQNNIATFSWTSPQDSYGNNGKSL